MPLNGGGTASRVPGTTAVPNTTIKSADYNAEMDDLYNILNTVRPVAYGGTGEDTASLPDTWTFHDPADDTKKMRLDAGAVTAGQTRVLSMADRDIDLDDYLHPGAVVGGTHAIYSTYFGGSDAIPVDDTIPQSSEGSGLISFSYTPRSATNKLRIRATVQAAADGLRNVVAALFVGSGSDAVKTAYATSGGALYYVNVCLEYEAVAGTTSPITIALRAGPGGGGVCYFNGSASARLFGGTSATSLTVEEIKV